MEKGNKKKRELQNALKMLAIEKGYANVTMKDIGEYVGLSVGGLYHHYHDVEEIFGGLLESETGDVWDGFSNVKRKESLCTKMSETTVTSPAMNARTLTARSTPGRSRT